MRRRLIPRGPAARPLAEAPAPAAAADPLQVLRALGVPGADAVRQAVGGFDTAVWRIERAGTAYALRLIPPGAADRCAREVAAMEAALGGGVPVPAVRAVGAWEGRAAVLMDWSPGESLIGALHRRPRTARRLGRRFGEVQATLHRLAAPSELNSGWLEAGGPALRARLLALPARTDALVHLDYHPLNVLTDGERITGVIDWANAGAGDARADLARTMTILRLDARRRGLLPRALSAALLAFDAGWREGYARESGGVATAALPLFYAWAGAAMERDLAGKRDEFFFARVRSWTRRWAAR